MDHWDHLQPHLRQMLGDEEYTTWIAHLAVLENTDAVLTLTTDNLIVSDWVRDHLLRDIETVARSHFGSAFRVLINPKERSESPPAIVNAPATSDMATHPFNPGFTFERFVVGSSNQFAAAAAEAVADRPGKAYNPLYLYGGSGLGKTHLLHAIANRLKDSPLRVVYMTTEQFVNELINCIRRKQMDAFRQTFRGVDLLLLDDIQFIAGKERTQEEFFHTFNALYLAHKQIVMTSDRPPKQIATLEERLVSRFESGLVTDVQPPDLETRIAILQEKAELDGISIPNDVIHLIANCVTSNIRELEGSLVRLLAFSSLTGSEITVDLAKEVLSEFLGAPRGPISVARIQQAVAETFGVPVEKMKARGRASQIAHARQVAMYLARELTHMSLAQVGEHFGGRDHTTVLHAQRKISLAVEHAGQTQRDVENLKRMLRTA